MPGRYVQGEMGIKVGIFSKHEKSAECVLVSADFCIKVGVFTPVLEVLFLFERAIKSLSDRDVQDLSSIRSILSSGEK